MKYIVLDLEWNQGNIGTEQVMPGLPFEIIEIGAIQLNEQFVMVAEFHELVKPMVYHEMHYITSKLIHMQMQELERGRPFPEVAERFAAWCGEEETRFCTWGGADLTELQRNLNHYDLPPLSDGPIAFLDVQKLFAIAYEDSKTRRALEYAVDYLGIEKDIPFHRAFSDAYYTAKVFAHLAEENPKLLENVSFDVYHVPKSRDQEIKIQFDTYAKYISRGFSGKRQAMTDREVTSSKCYLCHRNLRKKIRWFTPNGRNYYCLAYCEKHGYLKGKIRLRKTDEHLYYVVKTTKLISEEAAQELQLRKEKSEEQHRRQRAGGDKKTGNPE